MSGINFSSNGDSYLKKQNLNLPKFDNKIKDKALKKEQEVKDDIQQQNATDDAVVDNNVLDSEAETISFMDLDFISINRINLRYITSIDFAIYFEAKAQAESQNLCLVTNNSEYKKDGKIVACDVYGNEYLYNLENKTFDSIDNSTLTKIYDQIMNGKKWYAGNYSIQDMTNFSNIIMNGMPQKIDTEELFGEKDKVSASDLITKINQSEEPSLKKLGNILDFAYEKYGCKNNDEKFCLVESIMKILNSQNQAENSKPITLSQDIAGEINFSQITDIIQGEELQAVYNERLTEPITITSEDEEGNVTVTETTKNLDGTKFKTETVYDKNGNVKSVTETCYNAEDQVSNNKVTQYDENGRISSILEGKYGPLENSNIYLMSINVPKQDSWGVIEMTKIEYTYDTNGNVVQEKKENLKYWHPEEATIIDYEYVEKGRLIKKSTEKYKSFEVTIDGSPSRLGSSVTEYEYDENDNLVSEITSQKNSDGSITATVRTVYIYDTDGNLKEKKVYETEYDPMSGRQLTSTLTGYDSDGNVKVKIVDISEYHENGNMSVRRLSKYDSNGTLIYEIVSNYDNDGDEISTISVSFDSDGNIKEQDIRIFNKDGSVKTELNINYEEVRTAAQAQGLTLMKPEDFAEEPEGTVAKDENGNYRDETRVVAKDEDGNFYDFDPRTKEFVLRTPQRIADCIAGKTDNPYDFDIADAVAAVSRNIYIAAKKQDLMQIGNDKAIDLQGNIYKYDGNSQTFVSVDLNTLSLEDLRKLKEEFEKEVEKIRKELGVLIKDNNLHDEYLSRPTFFIDGKTDYFNELNSKMNSLQSAIQKVEKEISKIEINEKISNLEDTLNKLKQAPAADSELIAIFESQLEKIKQGYTDLPEKKLELHTEVQNLKMQLLNLKIPTPPVVQNYQNEDGSINQEAYDRAILQYEYEEYLYNQEINSLNAKISALNQEIKNIDLDMQHRESLSKKLEGNMNSVQTLQDLLETALKALDKELSSDIGKMLKELVKNLKEQASVNQKADDLYNELLNDPVPVPPSPENYTKEDGTLDEDAYQKACDEYEKAKVEYDKMQKDFNENVRILSDKSAELVNEQKSIVFEATAHAVESKIKALKSNGHEKDAGIIETKLSRLRKSFHEAQVRQNLLQSKIRTIYQKMNNLTIPTPPSQNNYIKADGTFDIEAFVEANTLYEIEKEQYDRTFLSLQNQIDEVSKEMKKNEELMAKLQSELSDLL